MKKLYDKSELTFAIGWIVLYCVVQSLANPLNESIGIAYSASALFCVAQAAVLFAFLKKNGLLRRYGLCSPSVPARRLLYYAPLLLLATENLWNGVAVSDLPAAILCRVVCMLCVGFLEEVIFRGLLYKAMAEDSPRAAMIVSSVTFGIGHFLNLINGSGMDIASNVCQVVFAIVMGFLFVTLFDRGGSLLPCILTHSAINALSTFANETGLTLEKQIARILIMTAVSAAYILFLAKTLPKSHADGQNGGN